MEARARQITAPPDDDHPGLMQSAVAGLGGYPMTAECDAVRDGVFLMLAQPLAGMQDAMRRSETIPRRRVLASILGCCWVDKLLYRLFRPRTGVGQMDRIGTVETRRNPRRKPYLGFALVCAEFVLSFDLACCAV